MPSLVHPPSRSKLDKKRPLFMQYTRLQSFSEYYAGHHPMTDHEAS